MAVALPNFRGFPIWVPLSLALAWIATLAAAADLGTASYAIPFVSAAALAMGIVFLRIMQGSPYAIGCALVFVIFVLNLNFRTRNLGDVMLDWQNGVKLATWIVLPIIAAARWRSIARLLREPMLALAFVYALIALGRRHGRRFRPIRPRMRLAYSPILVLVACL
jgi:hypothetical protein